MAKEKQKTPSKQTKIADDVEQQVSETAEGYGTDISAVPDEKLREYAKILIDGLVKENEQLIAEQEQLKKQIEKGDKYLDQLAAMKNDFENYRRRTNSQSESLKEEGKSAVIQKLLPVLDTFDRAKEMADEKTIQVLGLIVRQFEKVLAECGVEVIDVLGKTFDPQTAFAVNSVKTDKEEEKNIVLEVYANGYKYGDKVLRYAQVSVGV